MYREAHTVKEMHQLQICGNEQAIGSQEASNEALFEVLEFVGGMVLPFNAPQKIACQSSDVRKWPELIKMFFTVIIVGWESTVRPLICETEC